MNASGTGGWCHVSRHRTVGDTAQPTHGGEPWRVPIWAKNPENLVEDGNPYPLLAHLLDTAVVAGVIWDRYLPQRLRVLLAAAFADGDDGRARSLVMLAAGLHDVGKANPVFQLQAADSRDLSWRGLLRGLLAGEGLAVAEPAVVAAARGEEGSAIRRHEYVGYLALNGGEHPDASDRAMPRQHWLSVAASGHHGRWHLPRGQGQRLSPRLCDGAWGAYQQGTVDAVLHALELDRSALSVAISSRQSAVPVVLVTGLVILADWLASDEDRVAHGQRLIAGGLAPSGRAWMAARSDLVDHVLATVGTYQPPQNPTESVLGEHAAAPRALQVDAISMGNAGGLWTVAYPTGEGKTEAALLRHMHAEEGLLFALPTRATTDAMHARLGRIFATTNQVVLSHQFAAAKQPSTVCGADPNRSPWFTKSIRRLVAPVAAMTCDQVLTGATGQQHGALRLFALAAHHVVLDEVHTFDHYQTELLSWISA